jgi:hypothetical protein
MEQFPPNNPKASAAARGPKKVEQVTSAKVVRRRRPLGKTFKETFINGSARMAVEYMVAEVVIPGIQDAMIEAFQGGVERLIRGESRGRRGAPTPPSAYGRVNYGAQFQSQTMPHAQPPRGISRGGKARHDFGELVLQSRHEADDVLSNLFDIINKYETVTVADMYALCGIEPTHVDYKWGWTSLEGAQIGRPRGGGYRLDLPAPSPLGR